MTREHRIKDPIERFWSYVNKTRTCWVWRGTILKNGYGQFTIRNTRYKAHRFAYAWLREGILSGITLDHICRNRACVNPDHLEPVTNRTNILRGIGPTAVNKRKTHCSHGHRYTPENTVKTKKGRECRTCRNNYFFGYNKTEHRKAKMKTYRKNHEKQAQTIEDAGDE